MAVKVFNKSLLNRQARGFAFGRRKKDPKVRAVSTFYDLIMGRGVFTFEQWSKSLDPACIGGVGRSLQPELQVFRLI